MEKIKVVDAINQIMRFKLTFDELLFYSEKVGYLCVDEIYFGNTEVEVKNNYANISEYLGFKDELFLMNCEKTIDK